ncbi:THxN family PEP-CTERM protein [Leptothoe sp. ISB3NOV94-8A]
MNIGCSRGMRKMFNVRKRNAVVVAGAVVLGLGVVGSAQAIAVSLQTSGTFEDTVDVDGNAVAGEGTNEITWGIPLDQQVSGYKFEGINLNEQDITESFLLGNFTHYNYPIFPPSLEKTDLNLALQIGVETFKSIFEIDHFETPNSATSCTAGGVALCPDLVTFTSLLNTESSFQLDEKTYNLQILGFSTDGGNTITETFLTLENQTNTASLYGQFQVVEPVEVSEPRSMLGILAFGAIAYGATLRRRPSSSTKT